MKCLKFMTLFICSSGYVNAETWHCSVEGDSSGTVVVTAIGFDKQGSGEIKVTGKTHKAFFKITGFEHRWDFGSPNSNLVFRYAFIIQLDGFAVYYDFKGSNETIVQPRMTFWCRQHTTQ